ncbi:metalloendopeptidase OMA1, mitochondrial [Anguilla rostrata]|uniref:metalloendopeptidase OMA1, mitochondrial n=1 Tax=Anguilla rostrata TaxID=7938 RepID=UPI0030D21EA9
MELICIRFIRNRQLYNLRAYSQSRHWDFSTSLCPHKACSLKNRALAPACFQAGRGSPSPLCEQLWTAVPTDQQRRPVCHAYLNHPPVTKGRLFSVGVSYQKGLLHHNPAAHGVHNFHTSGPLRALPIPLIWLVLKPLQKLVAIVLGRSIRKWWVALPANRQQLLREAVWRRRWHLAAGGAALLVALSVLLFTHLDESPVTGRTRLLVFTRDNFMELANVTSEGYMEEYKDSFIPLEDPMHKVVETLVKHLAQRNQDIEEVARIPWSVHVVDSPTINAFALPNGKVFIFTGMLEAVADVHQLTFILGHEMAHALIGHSAEQASLSHVVDLLSLLFLTAIWAVCPQDSLAALGHWVQGKLVKFMFNRPFSRKLEAEADQVGLLLAAKACADVRAGPVFWQQMEISNQLTGDPTGPEWLSTHPSHRNRGNKLDRLVPEALKLRASCDCPALPGTDPRVVFSESVKLLLESVKSKGQEGAHKGPGAPAALARGGTQPAGALGALPSLTQALVSKQAEQPPHRKPQEDPKTP